MPDRRVLVVGTTPDYVEYIDTHYPVRALFLCHPGTGASSGREGVDRIICDLTAHREVLASLRRYLDDRAIALSGVACFDCERLSLAAELARDFRLPYPSPESVAHVQNKYRAKQSWSGQGTKCPEVEMVASSAQTNGLVERFGGPVVLKPAVGTGSELTYLCRDSRAVEVACRRIANRTGGQGVLAEAYVGGQEYSADFFVKKSELKLIRVARKLYDDDLPFGAAQAYQVPASLPGDLPRDSLERALLGAVRVVGLTDCVGMVDFKVWNGEIIILEISPRIGGDCLPPLIRKASGLDTIGMALDFAEGREIELPPLPAWRDSIGMRLLAPCKGRLVGIDVDDLRRDPRVTEVHLRRKPGHEINPPPEDVDSWVLGHVLFSPDLETSVSDQCRDIRSKISIEVDRYHEPGFAWAPDESGRTAQSPNPVS